MPHSHAHLCRVCGYFSEEPPWGLDRSCLTYEYCPCCGVEWGYQASLCGGLGCILDPAVLHDVTTLADHVEPGIALDVLCDRLLDANAPLNVAQRGRLLTVGRAMGLDDTVAFLTDAPAEHND
ncbi:hypothetical protein NS220_06265 [Microbacterium testaceum]|uniref:Uncharacterized protein n=1 Tax=Microbacterium testaceum TaxID=2033 RepID=A0A147EYQ1_MICTE|nr:hypothetical protein [Microbacterium testaceum]KTR95394.1 hypothetical protein NS220_06265 [Microbacterium testaceum]